MVPIICSLCEALEERLHITVLGGLSHKADITILERHLELVTPAEHQLGVQNIERLATFVEDKLDLDLHLRTTQFTQPPILDPLSSPTNGKRKGGKCVRFAIARDGIFCFYYPMNLEVLKRAGAELVFFSLLHDTHLPLNL